MLMYWLMTVSEWNRIQGRTPAPAVDTEAESIEMDRTVTVEFLETAAAGLGILTSREGPYTVRLEAPWDDPRLVGLRKVLRRGAHEDTWPELLAETQMRQGSLLTYDPVAA